MKTKQEIEQQIKELQQELEQINFKVGDWVIIPNPFDKDDYINILKKLTDRMYSYGFNRLGNWSDGIGDAIEPTRKATFEEVQSALIREAKMRGFKDGVTANNSNVHGEKYGNSKIKGELTYNMSNDELYYYTHMDMYSIYKQGKWAEVVKDEPIYLFGSRDWKVETDDAEVHIGCQSYTKIFLIDMLDALEYVNGHSVKDVIKELIRLDL